MQTQNLGRIIGTLLGIILIGVLLAAGFSGSAAAHTGDDGLHHHDGWMGSHGGMGGWTSSGFGFLWMVLWPLVLIGFPVIVGYLVLTRRGSADGMDGDEALVLLRQRYAQGDIDEGEFDARRRKLMGGE